MYPAGRGSFVKPVHLVVGVLAIGLTGVAGLYGAWCWWRVRASVWFWRVLRASQAVVVLQVVLGGVLYLTGRKPSGLHVLYGVLPLLVLEVANAVVLLAPMGCGAAMPLGKLL